MAIKERKTKSGKIAYDVRVQYGGIRVSRTVPTTYTEARRVEARILNDLVQGKYEILRSKQNPRFKEYGESYLKSVTWQKSYERTCRLVKNLVAYFDNKRLTEISVTDFINYRTMRLAIVKPATVNREHACLKRMLNLAVQSDDFTLNRNPLRGLRLLEEKPVEDRTLTVEEYYKLLDAAPVYFRRIIFFACNTAMRRTEILNLKFRQIKLWPGGAEIELTDTKSGKRETVPLSQEVQGLLFEIADERGIDLRNLDEESGSKYVFLGKKGNPLRDLRHPTELTFRKAGIEYKPFHTFRHFWTSEMFNAGVDVGKIKKMGRWGDLTTMLRYCHSNRSEEQEAINALSTHLNKRPNIVKFVESN